MSFDSGSFRDPSGRIVHHGDRIYRAIFKPGLAQFEAVRAAGLLDELFEKGWLIPAAPVAANRIEPGLRELAPHATMWVEHPKIDFISYPYEWSFSGLKRAALLHLDLHMAALKRGFTLSDATAYNVQFIGTRPVFIDHLSLIPYVEGSAWAGQRQFGMQFLNPLFLWAKKGIAPHAWYRGSVEGIEPEELVKLLGWRDRLSFTVLAHIVGPAAYARHRVATGGGSRAGRDVHLPKPRLLALLSSLRDYLSGLALPGQKTIWDDYAANNSYDDRQREAKHRFVAQAVGKVSPRLAFDLGCNSGDFCQTALSAGASQVVGFDFDLGALERAFARFESSDAPVLPLWLDAANPSPSQGWAGAERTSLQARGPADTLLALAVIHHLAIARNVPLEMAVDWLMGLGTTGVIEFPSKGDPMVQQLLRNREDIFQDYTEEAFLHHVGQRGRIVNSEHLGEDGRLIVEYDRRAHHAQ